MNRHAPTQLKIEADGEHHVLRPSDADRASSISDLLRHAGMPLNTRCGGRGICDGCQVEILAGQVRNLETGQPVARRGDQGQSFRACEHSIDAANTHLRIPARSSMKHQPQIVSDYQICVTAAHDPLIAVEKSFLGVAIDIGTTTVAVMLVDLSDGKVLARASKFNEQIHLGEDVITRINQCMVDPGMVGQLQRAIAMQTILPLLEQVASMSGRGMSDIRCLSVAGNTTMLHLFAGIDPTPMGISPFTPVFLQHRVIAAGDIFGVCSLRADTPCHLLPGAAAYIGADLAAGIVATGLLYEPRSCLLIDIGTNGEIILKHGDQLIGCATAAGPAFEGARLSCGMRAVDGAISHLEITSTDVTCETIGGATATPVGICGSAYVDFLAKAHTVGVLGDAGRYDASVGGALAEQLMPWSDGRDVAFRLAYGPGKQPIVITQRDIAALLQAKAAIAAGTLTLLDHFGIKPSDIDTLFLAGGFGTHLNRAAAIECGLLRGFSPHQVRPVGNTSLAGAYLALMDTGLLNETRRAANDVKIIELNLDPSFESRFIDELVLP